MKELDNIKAFISIFNATDYNVQIGCGGMFIALVATLTSFSGGINTFELMTIIVIWVLEVTVVVLYIRKRRKYIYLYTGLSTLAFSAIMVLMFISHASYIREQYIINVITFIGLFFITPAIMSELTVRRRINNDYYKKSTKETSFYGGNSIISIGMIVGAVTVANMLTGFIPKDSQDIIIFLFCGATVGLPSYKGMEHLIRHFFIWKYNLEDAIRFRPDHEFW